MDELRSFFNDPRPSQSNVVKLKGPLTAGFRITKEDTLNELNRREDHRHSVILSGTDYAREVKEREIAAYLKNETERDRWDSMSDRLESLEHLSSLGTSLPNIGELTEEAMTEVYSKYSFQMKEDTNNLSINSSKTDILDRIRGFPVVIIEGPTGCGKTTQVPQWILDDCHKHRRACKIIVTQPRRIAAISIAKRVAQERGWDVGGLVGYQVGLENRTSNDTRIHYVTTGVLLQKLVNAKTMNEYTHIILDEVHERGQDMDFLLLVVKKLLYTVSPTVKVILMSATFQTQKFADYFMIPTPRGQHMASCIQVNKKDPMFSVKTFYLEQLSKFGSLVEACTPKAHEPTVISEMYHLVVKLVNAFEQIDMTEDKIANRSEADLPSVLIFLPGINEIEDQYNALTDMQLRKKISPECPRYNWWVLPLHSTITADEQVRVFQRAPPGHRKLILATNIAESSITVPDIKYVIDFCLMKILVADSATNFSTLSLTWASKSNCEQRAGRAGRVRDGRVYRLVPAKYYDKFQQDSPPEIVRCPLERLVLLAKMLDMGPPSDVLALAMDPPEMANIQRTMLVLKEIGALKKTVDGEWSSSDGELTYMGRIMARLPLDVKVSKIIILGHIFGCLEDSIIMAAALSVKNVCSSPFRERLNAYNAKLTWADGSTSDCVAFLHIYKVWDRFRQQQFFKQKGNSEAAWARRFYVQLRALRELGDMVRELRHRLSREGVEAPKGSPWAPNHLAFVHKVTVVFYVQLRELGDMVRELRHRLSREGVEAPKGSPWAPNHLAFVHKVTVVFYVQLRELGDMVRELRHRLSREGVEAPKGSPWAPNHLAFVHKVTVVFYVQLRELGDMVRELRHRLSREGVEAPKGSPWAPNHLAFVHKVTVVFYVQLRELGDMVRELRHRLSREGVEAPKGSPWAPNHLAFVHKVTVVFYVQLRELGDMVRELRHRLSREGVEAPKGSPWAPNHLAFVHKVTVVFYVQLRELGDMVRELRHRLSREGVEAPKGSPWAPNHLAFVHKVTVVFYVQLRELGDMVRELRHRLSREGVEAPKGSPWAPNHLAFVHKVTVVFYVQLRELGDMVRELRHRLSREGVEAPKGSPWAPNHLAFVHKVTVVFYVQLRELGDMVRELRHRLSREGVEAPKGSPWAPNHLAFVHKVTVVFYVQLRELGDMVRELRHRLSREGVEAPKGSPWAPNHLAFVHKVTVVFYVQLRELGDMVRELRHRLSCEGVEAPKGSPWAPNHLAFVHKVILAGAFYPQYFVHGSQNETRERDALRELNGLDPRTTVYLKNFPDHQPGNIYAAAIKNKVHELIKEEPRVTFDKNSRKVFLTFPTSEETCRGGTHRNNADRDPTIPGQILLAVYKAIKARQQKMEIRIPLLPLEEAKALAEEMSQSRSAMPTELQVPRLPSIDQTYFPLKVTQFTSVGKFWVQYDEETALSEYNEIQAILNCSKLLSYTDSVSPGDLVAAPYTDQYVYRARVQKVVKDMVEIAYIDFGTFGRIAISSLRVLPPGLCITTPPLAMPCRLAELAPAPLLDSHAQWSQRAETMFKRFVSQPRLMGKVRCPPRCSTRPVSSTPPLAMPCRLAELAPAPLLDSHAQWSQRAETMFKRFVGQPRLMGKVRCPPRCSTRPVSSTPPLAMPCRLAELAPAPLLDSHAQWSQRAETMFKRFVSQPRLMGKVRCLPRCSTRPVSEHPAAGHAVPAGRAGSGPTPRLARAVVPTCRDHVQTLREPAAPHGQDILGGARSGVDRAAGQRRQRESQQGARQRQARHPLRGELRVQAEPRPAAVGVRADLGPEPGAGARLQPRAGRARLPRAARARRARRAPLLRRLLPQGALQPSGGNSPQPDVRQPRDASEHRVELYQLRAARY
ncbi:uncharacterized protein LOC133528537 isoform X1 [Cydia pomonella]|uniref:uncharacterized protein LOC133528537 isoform X1 n=1 Tax=Cydia pomonella TaxID=82600 RepID=UPI002ADDC739|nr:uncharacterized protein LOC133528537 isoform X1 [Cydia pomonella]